MSNRYKGAIISATPPTTTGGPFGTASGAWTLEQQMQLQAAGLWPSQPPIPYIEDVFSTWLYTGNSSTQNIVNGIDLSTYGGLVWLKGRSLATSHYLYDTVRGIANGPLSSENTNAAYTANTPKTLTSFNSDGFSMQDDSATFGTNVSPRTYVSWTFREQPKFFDVVTYTGNGTSNRQISHSLGSVPGCIFIKKTNGSTEWVIYHRSLPNNGSYLKFTSDAVAGAGGSSVIAGAATSTYFLVGNDDYVNASGGTYVAYVFAHDAGGFGLTGTDNVISCGSYTGDGSSPGPIITLGYEPQFLMIKRVTTAGSNWVMVDNMRGFPVSGSDAYLSPNLANAETTSTLAAPNATGFQIMTSAANVNFSGNTYIYIAIRRGPMEVPTTGTSVYKAITYNGVNTAGQVISGAGFPPDLALTKARNGGGGFHFTWMDRLRGTDRWLFSDDTAAEGSVAGYGIRSFDMDGVTYGTAYGDYTNAAYTYVAQFLLRAPGFFDEVCYTGTGVARTITHNLAAVPELMIIKQRSNTNNGVVYTASGGTGVYLRLFSTSSDSGNTSTVGDEVWNSTTPTSSVFSVGTGARVNGNTSTYVAWLFATCAGVSKVGSYTGTGATQTINCGFTGGARFVLIKKSTSTAPDRDWYVWDTARGMVSGTDPSLKLNTTAAEVNANDVYTITTGFQLVSSSDYVNASGVTYIFLAIA